MAAAPALSVVVVNWSQRDLLDACLRSVAAAAQHVRGAVEVVVVDNASRDDSAALVRERHPDARLLELPQNRGFAGGVDAGIRAASAPLLFLLNNDATVEPDALALLVAEAARHPRAGALAAQLRFVDGGAINSAGLEIDRLGVVADRHLGRRPQDSDHEPTEVFGASAGAALLRREMLDAIGGFDPGFFMFLEDADVAWRARAAGWGAVSVPGAVVHHHHSISAGHQSPLKYFYVGRNRVRLLARNMTARQIATALPQMLAHDAGYVAYALARDRTLAPLRGRVAGLREWRAVRDRAAPVAVALAPAGGLRAALARRSVWMRRSAGRSV